MRQLRLPFAFILGALLASACGNDMPFDPEDPRLEDARLEIIGSSAVNLGHGETAALRVRYVAADGSVISSAPIDYEIVGDGAGSRLAALQTTTDADGEAAMDLTAGSTNTTFEVRVSVSGRDTSVAFSVAVSDVAVGSIVVSMTYPGERSLDRIDTFLFEGEDCSTLDPMALPTAIRMAPAVSDIDAMPAFAGVPAGSDYTVAVSARNTAAVVAFGCRDGIVVNADEETPVNITLMDVDIPPSFVGVWDLDNRFDFAGTLPGSVETFIDALDELTDDDAVDSSGDPTAERFSDTDGDGIFPEFGVDPGAFIVDLLMRQTCAWECPLYVPGSSPMVETEYDTCEPDHRLGDLGAIYVQNFGSWDPTAANPGARSRFFGGCGGWEFFHTDAQNLINDQVNSLAPGWVTDWLQLAGDLSRAINNARIQSVLTINAPAAGSEFDLPMTHELVEMVVVVHDPTSTPAGMERTFTFALADAGFTSLMVEDTTTVDGTTLTIPEHSFTLNWGELVLYIYRYVVLQEIYGVADTGELLQAWVDCAEVGTRLYTAIVDNIGDPGLIDADDLTSYCMTGLNLAGTAIEGAIGSFLDVDGTLTIRGTAEGADIDESTGQVDTLENGVWMGRWGEGSMEDDISGTFTGLRRVSP